MRAIKLNLITLLILFALVLTTSIGTKAQETLSVIDFEGIPAGTIVDTLSSGNGISGDPVEGVVTVNGFNPVLPPGTNAAMIFDATCPPGNVADDCSGGDDDLFNPAFGNILIISEDLDSTDPDDADIVGAVFEFIFTDFGPGSVTVDSIEVQDVEFEEFGDAMIELFAAGLDDGLIMTIAVPETGDGQSLTVPLGIDGVGAMRVDLDGSGAIDNVEVTTAPTAVDLLYFQVNLAVKGQVSLAWATATEIDNIGFKIYRSPDANFQNAVQVHFETADGKPGAHSYSFTDTPPNDGPWLYWLADVDTQGKETIHGKQVAFVQAILNHVNFLPILLGNQ